MLIIVLFLYIVSLILLNFVFVRFFTFLLQLCNYIPLSISDIGVPLSFSFEFFENNYTKISLRSSLPGCKETPICSRNSRV